MHRWGYAPTVEGLAAGLIGGAVSTDLLLAVLAISPRVAVEDGFVYLRPHAALLARRKAMVSRASGSPRRLDRTKG